jgi:hypothetical protein
LIAKWLPYFFMATCKTSTKASLDVSGSTMSRLMLLFMALKNSMLSRLMWWTMMRLIRESLMT